MNTDPTIRKNVVIGRTIEQIKARGGDADEGFLVIGALVAVMWVVEIVNAIDGQRLSEDGIISRHLSGLPGILSAPFLHASFGHLISNTVPFVILGLVIALAGAREVIVVTVIVAVCSGLGAWLLAPSGTDTVGASGVVFGYATFLMTRGVFTRSVLQIAVGVIVAVLFGGALVLSLVPHPGISWQGHLFGAIGGVIAARVLAAPAGSAAATSAT
jgi:membrane associated rhomboid family serine protease